MRNRLSSFQDYIDRGIHGYKRDDWREEEQVEPKCKNCQGPVEDDCDLCDECWEWLKDDK